MLPDANKDVFYNIFRGLTAFDDGKGKLIKAFEKMYINFSEGDLVSGGNPLQKFWWASIRGNRVVHQPYKIIQTFLNRGILFGAGLTLVSPGRKKYICV